MDPANEAGAIPGPEVLQSSPEGSPPTWVQWGRFSPGATPPIPAVAGAGSPVVCGFGGCWFWGLQRLCGQCSPCFVPVLFHSSSRICAQLLGHQGGAWTPPGRPARRGEQPWGSFGMGFPGCSSHLAASCSVSDAPGLPEPPPCPPAARGITGTRGEASP